MYLVELAKQVLEWRITAPKDKTKYFSENKPPTSGNDLLSRFMGSKDSGAESIEQTMLSFPKVRIVWTGNKVDLVELIYAWEKAGCFNHGHAKINEIADYIEIVFNIDLGDYYHTFSEMRNRANRTAFLDKLIRFLIDRMDEADRKK